MLTMLEKRNIFRFMGDAPGGTTAPRYTLLERSHR